MTPSVDIIIVAAGSGLRYGAPLPKQFCLLGGRPVVMHTIGCMRQLLPAANIRLVISRDMAGLWQDLCRQYDFSSPQVIYGGDNRWQSVHNALSSLTSPSDIIMVHDAVRPLVSPDIIDGILAAMAGNPDAHGVIPAIAVTDSLRKFDSTGKSEAVDRSTFCAVQTPQAFRGHLLLDAYRRPYQNSFTDDASVMEAAGYTNLLLSKGSPRNLKITNPGDIDIALLYMSQQDVE